MTTLDNATHDEALVLFAEQLAVWDLTMPPVEPIVSDCGLGTFYEVGVIEYWIANEVDAGKGLCGTAVLGLPVGASVDGLNDDAAIAYRPTGVGVNEIYAL